MKFFEPIRQKIEVLQKLNEIKVLHSILRDKEFQQFVLDLNRENQLFDEGIDANSRALAEIGGGYSGLTKAIKKQKGQPFNRVTLKDTGDFYASFKLKTTKEGFDIVADTLKESGDLRERWGKDILGLTDESKNELVFRLIPLIHEYLRKKLKI